MSAAQRTAGPAPRNCGPGTSGPCTRPSFSTGRTAVALALDLLEFSAAEADPPADVFADLGEDSFQCANRLATGAVGADMVHQDDKSGGEKVRNQECNHGIAPTQCAQPNRTSIV